MAERQWWASRDEEFYTEGPFRFREDAIDAGRECFGDEGYPFVIAEVTPAVLRFDAVALLDAQYYEQDDLFDHDYATPGWSHGVKKPQQDAAMAALQGALDAWVAEFGDLLTQPNMFAATHSTEEFAPTPGTEDDDERRDPDAREWE